VLVDGERLTTLDARAAETSLGVHRIELDDGPHEIRFVAGHRKYRTRLLGVALERSEPGFVIDSFGVGALNSVSQAREDPAINRAMLRARNYDLVIFATGANDPFTIDQVPEAMARLIYRQREALERVPILIITPADRGKQRTLPGTLMVVEQRMALAKQHKTAFWSLFDAMGGKNSMKSLRRRGLAKHDYIHFTERGGEYAASRLTHALWRELDAYLEANPRAGCKPADEPLLNAQRSP
jgi:hypothetical protein